MTRSDDGRVIVRSSSFPHGQGHDTTYAQIVADRLGVPIEDVELRFGDSASSPAGVGTFGGRSIAMAGSAIAVAADRLAAGERTATVRFESEMVFGSGAYAAIVEIDEQTGAVTVHRIAAVDDAGTIINPLLAEGQVLGGTIHGLGTVLTEEFAYDADGQPLTGSFVNYALLSAGEQPPVATAFVESPSPLNPLGAKGIGEAGTIGTPAAIANAVTAALGGRWVDPPFTPEKLWRAAASHHRR
jgi:carbon-monoxide dehydrogenase large subunit